MAILVVLIPAILYITAIIAIFLAEAYFIKKRKRTAELVFPLIIIAVGVVLIGTVFKTTMSAGGINSSEMYNATTGKNSGHIYYLSDVDRNLVALGQAVIGEGENSRYLNVKFDSEGRMTGSKSALKYRGEIMEALSHINTADLENMHSVTYGELEKIKEKTVLSKSYFDPDIGLKIGLLWVGIPSLLPLIMCIITRLRRKKRNQLEKIMLDDL